MLSETITKALDARCCLAMSKILADKDEAENMELAAGEHAYDLGFRSYYTKEPLSPLLAGESILRQEWENGRQQAENAARLDVMLESEEFLTVYV